MRAIGAGRRLTNPPLDVRVRASLYRQPVPVPHAEVAELVDALASGASWGNSVEVQVLSSAPNSLDPPSFLIFPAFCRPAPTAPGAYFATPILHRGPGKNHGRRRYCQGYRHAACAA